VVLKIKRAMTGGGPNPPTPSRGTPVHRPIMFSEAPGKPQPSGKGVPARTPIPRESTQATPGTGPLRMAEVRKDVLETTRIQLLQALEIDPRNVKAHAMLLVTHYHLGMMDAVMHTLRHARERGISAEELKGVSRCEQVVKEEMQSYRLPMELHSEFMGFFGWT
jgi:hypothetical protein